MFEHRLHLVHDRQNRDHRYGRAHYANSIVEVDAASTDLVEAWRELLSRLPNDVYAALKTAMGPVGE